MVKWRRRIAIAVVAAGIALGLFYGFMPKPVPVDAAAVTRGPLVVAVEEEGRTRVKDRYTISAPVDGYARRIARDVGDAVKRGEAIIEIEPARSRILDPRSRAEADAKVEAATAALKEAGERVRAASADYELATRELKRVKGLFEAGYVPGERMDQAEADYLRAEAGRNSADFAVRVAMFELEAARTALRYSSAEAPPGSAIRLRSPVSGSVLKIFRESEGAVKEGEPLVEIGDPKALEVEVDVLSDDAVRIRPGGRVILDRWGGEAPLEGRVRVVEPAGFTKISALGVEEQRVLVIADITSPYEVWKRLGDGYRVEARFVIWEGTGVLQVPGSALFRRGDGWAVFVVENKRARVREVKVGNRSGLSAEVLSGLSEGEAVITHPDGSIEDGTRVKVR